MVEERRRKESTKRLSIFTDILIIIVLLAIFWLFTVLIKKSNLKLEDELALENVDVNEQNSLIAQKIYSKFGVKVVYGNDAETDANRVTALIQEDIYAINSNLMNIYNAFLEYPENYFKNLNLTVVIVDKFLNNNIALASRNSSNQYKIYISNAKEYKRAMNHEMYHVFEYTLDLEVRDEIMYEWDKLNPEDFSYNSNIYELTDEYVYIDDINSEIYFATLYSKSSHKEDRAEIFAELMSFDTKKQQYFTHISAPTNHIVEKAKFIIDVLGNKYSRNDNLKWDIFK